MNDFDKYLDAFLERALAEDIGPGDHSSNCSISPVATGKMQLLVKDEGVLAGVNIAKSVFQKVDKDIKIDILIKDGESVKYGDVAYTVSGRKRSLLQAERLALNIMQRMSGIATKTRQFADIIEGTHARVLDTRKTTPNLRPLEKMAVRIGGGYNHRMGLYDMIMLKDNHIDFAGGIKAAIEKAHAYMQENNLEIPIEIETRNHQELDEVLQTGGIQRVMFDNYSVEDTLKGVEMVNGRFETESSGGINESTIRSYAETGVDFISVGALTYSVRSLDMSLKVI